MRIRDSSQCSILITLSREVAVTVAEGGWKPDPKGLKSSYGNCFGWTQMLCCLKCHLERGFNLREGFF